jgi:hypothetical protein
VRGPRPQVAVKLGGQLVKAGTGGREVDPGRVVGPALGQRDLPGQQELAAADGGRARQRALPRSRVRAGHAQAGGHTLDPVHGVAAPGDVQAVDLADTEGEARNPGDHHGGGIMAGMTATAFAQPQSIPDPMALRDPFRSLPSGEIQHLPDPAGQREDHLQAVHDVGLAAAVGQRVPGPDRAARHRLDLGHQLEAGRGVRGLDASPVAAVLRSRRAEQRRPVTPSRRFARALPQPVSGQTGPAEPARTVLRQQGAGPDRPQQRSDILRRQARSGYRANPDGRQGACPREQDQAGAGPRAGYQPRGGRGHWFNSSPAYDARPSSARMRPGSIRTVMTPAVAHVPAALVRGSLRAGGPRRWCRGAVGRRRAGRWPG